MNNSSMSTTTLVQSSPPPNEATVKRITKQICAVSTGDSTITKAVEGISYASPVSSSDAGGREESLFPLSKGSLVGRRRRSSAKVVPF